MNVSESYLNDIVSIHRIKSSSTPRPLIIAFGMHDTKMKIIRQRKMLKKSKIVMTDDLCLELGKVLNRLRNDDRVDNAWSWDSVLYAKRKSDSKIATVQWGETFDELIFK